MDRLPPGQQGQNTLLSRILQVALGLFVTTSDLPPLPGNYESLSYDCSFDSDCRWTTVGGTMDKWRIAHGEPDSLLWLAATGTMQIPREPFALIEQRGNAVDSLMTDPVRCQKGYADLSFTYWAVGNADLEICLTDEGGMKFNCTGMLNARVMPGKVSLKIPEMQKPFRIMIAPNAKPGILIVDDIRYDATTCESMPLPGIKGRPDIMTTSPPIVIPWTMRRTTSEMSTTTEDYTSTEETTTTTTMTTTTTEPPTTTTEVTTPEPEQTTSAVPSTTTDLPFDLMIYGNLTSPFFDRRTGMIISESTKLLCGFTDEFACQWGPEAGRWAVIQKGAIPSLEDSVSDPSLLPAFPAALVLQGSAMLTSDPIRCQTGHGKVLFRYWSNGDVIIQVCALGYGIDSQVLECVDQNRASKAGETQNLAVFDIPMSIRESFTLNIVPQWRAGLKNRYLVLDEIAYIGECAPEKSRPSSPVPLPPVSPFVATTETTAAPSTTTEDLVITAAPATQTLEPTSQTTYRPRFITFPPVFPTKEQTKESYTRKKPSTSTTSRVTYPVELQTTKPQTRWNIKTTTEEPKQDDYCDLLNCNFDDTACNYLNHGLTKKPWTLRSRGYGYPLIGAADIRPTSSNNQFVATILDPGDIAILESPKFNATRSLNVLLFQYYRPAQTTTIRLCLGSRYTNPLRSASSFTQCPSILRSVTSRNAYRWNTVHVQLPPGTTHFFLVAHNSNRAESRAALALDNMRVAICDPRSFAPDYTSELENETEEFEGDE